MDHQHMTSSYMEHGYCFSWEPGLVGLHVASDIITGLSYYLITFAMFYVALKRRDLPILKILLLFGAFILSCGTTHFLAAYTVFVPDYWLEGGVKAFTAAISALSAVYVIPRLPEAVTFPSLASSLAEIKKLNAELNRKNAELQLANHSIDKVFDPVYWVAPEGKILRVNAAACASLGYSQEEMLAMSIADLDPHYPAERWPEHWAALKAATSLRFETQHRGKDGTLYDVEVVANYISYDDLEFNCATVRDISERKQLERLQAHRIVSLTGPEEELGDVQFEDLFDLGEIQAIQDAFANATGVASMILDPDGTPITKPSNFCHLCLNVIRRTGKGEENCRCSDAALGKVNHNGPIVQPCLSGGLWDGGASITVGGRHIASWLVGQVLDEAADMEAMVAYAREIGADEEEYRQALGQVKRMPIEQFREICNTIFAVATQLSRLAMQNLQQARHISERKKYEEERELLIRKLEDKTEELERFIYTVSHDLKSPLITISGFLGFLKEDFTARDEESFDTTTARISGAAEKMKQLLEELLELSRIGRKSNPHQLVDLNELVAEAAEMVAGRILETKAVIEVEADLPAVKVDRQRLLQVYENLIDNAVKFAAGANPPRVTVGVRREKEPVYFVSDNGVGIAPQYLSRIFDLFEKLDPRSSGTGVGLAIVHRVISVHGGTMWAESEGPGRGATFCFTLPSPQGEQP
jgi:PAS domain S-box-containing protein